MPKPTTHQGRGNSFKGCDDADPQSIIRNGYKRCTRRTYFIRFRWAEEDAIIWKDAKAALEVRAKWLETFASSGIMTQPKRKRGQLWKSLVELTTKEIDDGYSADIGVTFAGLQMLGVQDDLLNVFRRKSPAFAANAAVRAQRHLGDTGLSDVSFWDEPYRDDSKENGIHVVITTNFPWLIDERTRSPTENTVAVSGFEKTLRCAGLMIEGVEFEHQLPLNASWVEIAVPPTVNGIEHFGFRDGLTSPTYSSNPKASVEGHRTEHALGEILLGYPRNDGDNLYSVLDIPYKANASIELQAIPENDRRNIDFFKNSTFAALRKIEQDTVAFEQWMNIQAKKCFLNDRQLDLWGDAQSDLYEKTKIGIKSKMLGRTPSGKMLKPEMNLKAISLNPERAEIDEGQGFKRTGMDDEPIAGDDSKGEACPFSSHIRRMNPRDDPVTPFVHRALLRRGMPYTQGSSKGLLGLFFCADLVEQFEHLIGVWAQDRVQGIPDSSDCRDPLIGNHEPQRNILRVNMKHAGESKNIELKFDQPFVRTLGCSYLWFPSISTLGKLQDYFVK